MFSTMKGRNQLCRLLQSTLNLYPTNTTTVVSARRYPPCSFINNLRASSDFGQKRSKRSKKSTPQLSDATTSESVRELSSRSESSVQQAERLHDQLFSDQQYVRNIINKSSPRIDYGEIYRQFANRKQVFVGRESEAETRLVWEEQDCSNGFPPTPEAANLDPLHYLEQRDMWERLQVLPIPKFCVGSVVAVTRADRYSEEGFSKFVGVCIHINKFRNTKGHSFILRNVIMDDGIEITFPYYNPLIQKIEVLLHQRWENEVPGIGLRFLRDYPLDYCRIEENYIQDDWPEYTDTPTIRKWTKEDKAKVQKHFEEIFHSRSIRGKPMGELPPLYQEGFKKI